MGRVKDIRLTVSGSGFVVCASGRGDWQILAGSIHGVVHTPNMRSGSFSIHESHESSSGDVSRNKKATS